MTKQQSSGRAKSVTKITGIVTALVLLSGSFIYTRYVIWRRDPINCVRRFIEAARANDTTELRRCISRSSRQLVGSNFLGEHGLGFFLQGKEFRIGKEYVLKITSTGGETVKVRLKPGPKPTANFSNAALPAGLKDGIPLIIVREDGCWKIDLLETNTMLAARMLEDLKAQYRTTVPGTPPPGLPPPVGVPPLPNRQPER